MCIKDSIVTSYDYKEIMKSILKINIENIKQQLEFSKQISGSQKKVNMTKLIAFEKMGGRSLY
jgi:hypothetical protein